MGLIRGDPFMRLAGVYGAESIGVEVTEWEPVEVRVRVRV